MPVYLSVEQLVIWHAVILLHRPQVWTNKSLSTLIFNAAIRGYALSYLSSCAGRIRFLLGTPGMVALDLDASLKGLFQQIVQHLESISKLQGEIFPPSCVIYLIGFFIRAPITKSWYVFSKQEFRKDWLSILMIVTSARSSINIRHLEKATVSTGKEGLLSEGNAAYNWSRYSPTLVRIITSATARLLKS
ncbi:hypothetical protein POTOM_061222 [Populus tomentosa]|uniref:Uncharacterized protein n=1 Tax=Populus tomentosa TaxID=118781 RepID=A0A8X7XTI7_POPTO|nr:hypothetical protein POTOM_061222 [Populus tomentosa]